MGTLTQCIRRAGKALDSKDAEKIRSLRNQLRGEGLSEAEAAKEAVAAQMNAAVDARDTLLQGTPVAPGDLPRLSNYTAYELGAGVRDSAEAPYQVSRNAKTGQVTVTGDIDAARAALPGNLRGRATRQGLSFSGSAASRAYNALTGQSNPYSRAGEVTKHPVKDGKYVGAPDKFNTPGKISTLRKKLRQFAREGEPGKMWYENSSKAVLDYVGGDVQEARRLVALLSIYSPQAKVGANTTFALRAWSQYKAGEPIRVKSRSQDAKAKAALDDVDQFWSGEKTGNFFNNLLIEIDPSTADSQGATIDLWMMRAGQYANDAPNRSQYAFMEVETNRLAQELEWDPHQVQAAIWVALKARMENKGVKQRAEARSEKRGWIRFDKDSKGKKVRVILDAQKHRDNWLKEALQLDVQSEDTAAAKFDYSDGLRRHVGTFGAEGAAQDILDSLTDDAGTDVLALKLGLLADSGDLVVAPAAGDAGRVQADPSAAQTLNIYADTLRQVSGARRAFWWRPFYKSRKMDQNAVMISLDRVATDEEIAAAESVLDEHMEGRPWRDSFAILKDRNGMVLINQGAVPNQDLKVIASNPAIPGDAEAFAVDASIITGDQDGQLAGIGTERQRTVLAWARGFLADQGTAVAEQGVRQEASEEPAREVSNADIYENIELRPGTNEQQKSVGRSAVRDLQRRINNFLDRRRDGGADGGRVSVLGQRLLANFKAGEPNQLIGSVVADSYDLALLAQVYRDPRFETLRFVFVDKNDVVVGESAYSSRSPASVSFSEGFPLDVLRAEKERLGADGYYIMHNHPGGSAEPSGADRRFTRLLADDISGFRRHVVIDFNEYTSMDAAGEGGVKKADFGATNFTATPEIPHPMLGRKIQSSLDFTDLGRQLQSASDFVVILTTAKGDVAQITSLPQDFFAVLSEPVNQRRNRRAAQALLRSMARESGAYSSFLVMPENFRGDKDQVIAVRDYFTDIMLASGDSFVRLYRAQPGRSIDSMSGRTRVVSDRLAGLPETVEVDGKQVKFEDFQPAKDAARAYMEKAGLEYNEPAVYAELDRGRATRIARELERMEHNPSDPEVKASYDAMIDETLAQYEAVLDTGLEVRFIKGEDPYGNPRNAILDVVENNHMFVFSTRDGFGSNEEFDPVDNPLLRETKFKTADGEPMLANDVFRVVHDYFGHIKNGVGFRARGEENAWQSHAAMYSPLARRAMTTETRGQNSWVNFGPHAEFNRTASGADTVYADQKIGLLPIWVSEENRLSAIDGRNHRDRTAGLEGAVVDGRLQLTHYSRRPIERTDPSLAGTEADARARRQKPKVTYFGITQANENGYRREGLLGRVENEFSIATEAMYPANLDPESLWVPGDHQASIDSIKAAGYSGYWADNKQLGKVAVVWDPLQSNAGVREDSVPYEINTGGLYSALERAIADAKIPGLTPSKRNPSGAIRAESWLQYLRNRSIKQEEWRETGMRELLNNDPKRRFTRDELLSEMEERRVELGDIVSGEAASNQVEFKKSSSDWLRDASDQLVGDILDDMFDHMSPSQASKKSVETLRKIRSGELELEYYEVESVRSSYAILGSEEIGRWVLLEKLETEFSPDGATSSLSEAKVRVSGLVDMDRSDDEFLSGGDENDTRWEEYVEPGDYSDYHELKVTLPGRTPAFDSGAHFSEDNILGFVRATMRDDGARYFIEELQSDWHQQGRQRGYAKPNDPELKAAKEQEAAADSAVDQAQDQYRSEVIASLKRNLGGLGIDEAMSALLAGHIQSYTNHFAMSMYSESQPWTIDSRRLISGIALSYQSTIDDSVDWSGLSGQSLRAVAADILPHLQKKTDAQKALAEAQGKIQRLSQGAPDAPFKNDAWINLLAKRALIEAARRGADKISWISAGSMKERWSDEYSELYENLYDKKLPALMRRLTGEKAQKVASGFYGKDAIPNWEMSIPDAVFDKVLDEGLPMFQASASAGGMSVREVREAVADMPAAVNSRVSVIPSPEYLPDSIRDAMRRQGVDSISGYYDPQSQRVFLVSSAISSKRAAQATLLHESVGHRGIEAVMGPQINEFLALVNSAEGRDQVISDAYKYVREAYPDAPSVVHAAEVVARIAESDPQHSLVQRVIQWFRQTLRRMGFNVPFTNRDIVEALRRAKTAMPGQASDTGGLLRAEEQGFDTDTVYYHGTRPGNTIESPEGGMYFTPDPQYAEGFTSGLFGEEGAGPMYPVHLRLGRSKVVQAAYGSPEWDEAISRGIDDLGPEHDSWVLKDEDGNVDQVFVKDAASQVMTAMPRRGDALFRAEDTADNPTGFSVPDERLVDTVIRTWQDKFKQLKRTQAAIVESGGTVDESTDAYLAEELFHGKAQNDLEIIEKKYIEPLANKMAEYGITHAELDDYLYAVHAPERNAHIASINPKMPDGGSGMTDIEAGRILARARSAGKLEQLQDLESYVRGMLEAQREMILSGGLEDDGTVAAWQAKYNHYVPLKGFAEDTKEMDKPTAAPRTGRGFMIRGPESKRAMGRQSVAASPLSYTIMDLTEKVIRRRKNEVGNTLLALIEANPNPDYWEMFTQENPDITRRIARKRDPETGNMRDEVVETAVNMQGSPDYFMTKRDGITHYMKLKDPLLMRAMQNLGPQSLNSVLRSMAAVNRFMSSMLTSYAPEFVVSNFARDYQTALLNLQAEKSLGDAGKTDGKSIDVNLRKVFRAMRAINQALNGKRSSNPELRKVQDWFDEYRAVGAQTGYFDRKDIDGVAKDLNALVQMADGGFRGNAMKYGRGVAQAVEHMNSAVENAVRLAAYISGREQGLTEKQAASLAKNMTVNFNRRGEIGTTLNALYIFANASIQGTANFARTMLTFKPQAPGQARLDPRRLNNAQRIAVGLVAASYALSAVNRMAAGEDDDGENWYDKVPDYVRERNIVVMKSLLGGEQDGSYWQIPLPYGYNVFHVLGDNMEGVISGGRDTMQSATRTTLALLGSFSPIGFQSSESVLGIFAKNATPTPFTPVTELLMNENFAGSSIYTENFPGATPAPASSLGRRSTGEAYKALTMWLNQASGGSEFRSGSIDVNPDMLEHIVNHFLGSAGSFVGRTTDIGVKLSQGIMPESFETPFLRRLDGQVRPYDDQNTYYQRRDEIRQAVAEIENTKGDERAESRQELRGLLSLRRVLKRTDNQMKLERTRRDRVYADESLTAKQRDDKLKEIEGRMEAIVDQFNAAYVEAVGR